jgi:hypothetical protein
MYNTASFKPMQFIDYGMAEWTYIAAKKYGRDVLKLSGDDLVMYADHIVLNTQASGMPGHVAPIQWTPGGKLATVFQTFSINEFNHILTDVFGWHNLEFNGKSGFERTMMAARFLTATTIFNMVYEDFLGVRSPFPTPTREAKASVERDKNVPKAAYAALKELAESIPVIGGTIRWSKPGWTAFPAAVSPFMNLFRSIEKYVPNIGKYITGDDSAPTFNPRDLEAIGQLTGVTGTTQILKTISRLREGYPLIQAILGVRTDVKRKGAAAVDKKKKPTTPTWMY